jgi:hypothetical protein
VRRVLKDPGPRSSKCQTSSDYATSTIALGEGEVRYWSTRDLKAVFTQFIGPSSFSVDGYFGLGIRSTDAYLFPMRFRFVVALSDLLLNLNSRWHWTYVLADSLYVTSFEHGPATPASAPQTILRLRREPPARHQLPSRPSFPQTGRQFIHRKVVVSKA